ncbi:hypothetical protein JIP62_04760 [Brevundimonas vitis]|uniref:Uncharacterized protein n=1 Tax=Brevundimonas vitisensis TaxID=2800818 RepID=A0ABX7BQA6_9CAUL|nr:hypothetical protein [Brevundimonas vitisensis]QQQ19416.1 hypothetical protein JIP62_04760 [Brevundimonas vitisensis]
MGFYALMGSDRFNIYSGCAVFGSLMAVGMIQALRNRTYLTAGALVVLTAVVMGVSIWISRMSTPTVWIVPN